MEHSTLKECLRQIPSPTAMEEEEAEEVEEPEGIEDTKESRTSEGTGTKFTRTQRD